MGASCCRRSTPLRRAPQRMLLQQFLTCAVILRMPACTEAFAVKHLHRDMPQAAPLGMRRCSYHAACHRCQYTNASTCSNPFSPVLLLHAAAPRLHDAVAHRAVRDQRQDLPVYIQPPPRDVAGVMECAHRPHRPRRLHAHTGRGRAWIAGGCSLVASIGFSLSASRWHAFWRTWWHRPHCPCRLHAHPGRGRAWAAGELLCPIVPYCASCLFGTFSCLLPRRIMLVGAHGDTVPTALLALIPILGAGVLGLPVGGSCLL